jgi:2,3-dihydroxybenzoate decarboxylase
VIALLRKLFRPYRAFYVSLIAVALVCSMMEMGIDRILFSVDYPFAENPPGTEWLKTLPLGPEDTEKLLNGNARRLLKL